MARWLYTEAEVVTIAGREELDKAIEDGTLQTFRNRNKRMFRAYQVAELWSGIQREYSREYNSPENKCSTESEIHGAGSTELVFWKKPKFKAGRRPEREDKGMHDWVYVGPKNMYTCKKCSRNTVFSPDEGGGMFMGARNTICRENNLLLTREYERDYSI